MRVHILESYYLLQIWKFKKMNLSKFQKYTPLPNVQVSPIKFECLKLRFQPFESMPDNACCAERYATEFRVNSKKIKASF